MTEAVSESSSHLVEFYESAADLLPPLVRHIGTALRQGNDAIVIARPPLVAALSLELHRENIRTAFGSSRGRLTTLDAQTTLDKFMLDGWPNGQLFLHHVAPLLEKATIGDRTAVAYGEMVALLCEQGKFAAAIKLEGLWNELLAKLRVSLLCAYPTSLFSSPAGRNAYQHVCDAHTHVGGRTLSAQLA